MIRVGVWIVSCVFSVVAAAALFFCIDASYWHVLPLGFEGTLAYGALAFWFGSSFALITLALTVFALLKYGRTSSRVAFCIWSVMLVVGFGFIFLYSDWRVWFGFGACMVVFTIGVLLRWRSRKKTVC